MKVTHLLDQAGGIGFERSDLHCHCCCIVIVLLPLPSLCCCHCCCCVVAVVIIVLLPLSSSCHHHCHCHIVAAIVVTFIMSFGVHEGAGPRAGADGLSSIAWDAVAIVMHRGAGLRGPMDRSGCRKDLAREYSLSVDAEWKSALQGCWTMGKHTGGSSSIAWDRPWLVCVGHCTKGRCWWVI